MYKHDSNGTITDKKVKQLNYDKDCDKEINETYCVIEQNEALGTIFLLPISYCHIKYAGTHKHFRLVRSFSFMLITLQ